MLSKKDRNQLLNALGELTEVLRSISNRIVKTQGGTELYIELISKIETAEKLLKELKK